MIIPADFISVFSIAVTATLGWRFGMILIDQIDHWVHKFISWSRKSYSTDF